MGLVTIDQCTVVVREKIKLSDIMVAPVSAPGVHVVDENYMDRCVVGPTVQELIDRGDLYGIDEGHE